MNPLIRSTAFFGGYFEKHPLITVIQQYTEKPPQQKLRRFQESCDGAIILLGNYSKYYYQLGWQHFRTLSALDLVHWHVPPAKRIK